MLRYAMNLCSNSIDWRKATKYLHVCVYIIQSGTALKFNIDPTKRAFYVACNSIYMHVSGVDEIASLQES